METWPWSFLAARVLAVLIGTRGLVDLVFQARQLQQDWMAGLPAAVGILVGLLLWALAGAFADNVGLAVEDIRDGSRDDEPITTDDPSLDVTVEQGPADQAVMDGTVTLRTLASVAFAALGLYLVADAAPFLLYTLYRLARILMDGENTIGVGGFTVEQGVAASASLGLRLGLGLWVIKNADRLLDIFSKPKLRTARAPVQEP